MQIGVNTGGQWEWVSVPDEEVAQAQARGALAGRLDAHKLRKYGTNPDTQRHTQPEGVLLPLWRSSYYAALMRHAPA